MMQVLLVLIKNSFRKVTYIDLLSLITFLFVVIYTVTTFIFPPISRLDFYTFMVGVNHVTHMLPLYTHSYIESSFTYPPSVLLFFFPFSAFPVSIATSVWNTLSLLAILASSLILIFLTKKSVSWSFLFLFLSAMLLVEPVRETFLLGQNNCIVLLFILLSFFFTRNDTKKYSVIGGIFLGAAIALKVFPIFLLLYFLSKRKWLVSCIALSVFVLFLVLGTFGHLGYIQDYVVFASTVMSSHSPILHDESFSSFFLFALPDVPSLQTGATVFVYLCCIFLCYEIWKKLKKSTFSDFFFFSGILGSTILVMTPLAWVHHLVFLLPLCFVLLWQAIDKKHVYTIVLFILTLCMVFLNGEYVVLFERSMHLTETPLLYFHGLAGLMFALIGEFFYLSASKT